MKKMLALLLGIALFMGCLMPVSITAAKAEEAPVQLVCLNIGKADCMLLLNEDQAFLIDTGYEQTYPALQTMLSQYGITHLNGVFLTHCHKDHEGGLLPLAKSNIQVDAWYAPAIYYDVKEGKHPLQLAAAARGMAPIWLKAGMVIPAGKESSFTVLGPLTTDQENENNNSLVMRFESPNGSILLTGDMKLEEEADLLKAGLLSPTDVLKVGHHGDNKATGFPLLQAVQPKVGLILTNTDEEPDTPASSTLSRLGAAGCAVYVSQDARDAMAVELLSGQPTVKNIAWENVPPAPEGLTLRMDVKDDRLIILNSGSEEITLSGCQLYSSKGNDLLPLPDFTLAKGHSFIIGSRASQGPYDFKWDEKRVWHEKKRDMAILYDPWGRGLARTDNGREE